MNTDISLTDDPDWEIVGNLKQAGSVRRAAEDQLYNKYRYFIHEAVSKHNISEDDAFTAYSETLLAALESLSRGSFEYRSSLKTYLFRIFNNKCVDLFRKSATKRNSVNQAIPSDNILERLSDGAKSVMQKIIEREDQNVAKQKLEKMSDSCKEILIQHFNGRSDKEIAASMDYKSSDVVKTTRLRCLEKLRELYRQHKK